MEEASLEHEKEKQKYEKKIEDTQKKLKTMTEDRDSRIKRTRLLLDIQKKQEKQLTESYEQNEEMQKFNEDLKERVKDRDALEVELGKYKHRTKELESEMENNVANAVANAIAGGEMPWDTDPDLQDMSAREIKAILGKSEKTFENSLKIFFLVKSQVTQTYFYFTKNSSSFSQFFSSNHNIFLHNVNSRIFA